MASIKRKKDNNVISGDEVKYRCTFNQKNDFVVFSFKFLTNNPRYNLEKFNRSQNARQDLNTVSAICNKIIEMSRLGWQQMSSLRKEQGGKELLSYCQLSFKAYDSNYELNLTGDTKVHVYRFGSGHYRMIGYRGDKCTSVFYVLGFDFDYSAYDHG